AGGKSVPLPDESHSLVLNEEHRNRPTQVEEGPQNARDEKIMARDARQQQEMMKLYRQEVLKEQPRPDLIQIAPAPSKPAPDQELVHSGD
ncbi:MAG: radical SAM protein, partial [Acidobacteria bacterium]|nr:radical SAM protein [Acidobacteriota bacterium]